MKPVVIGDATLYLGDCLEILPTLGRVDAVITDPPFAITGGLSNGMTSRTDTQFFEYWFGNVCKNLISKVTPSASMAFWCDWRTVASFGASLAKASEQYSPWYISQVVIHDRDMIGMGAPFRNQLDWIAIVRGSKTDFGDRIPKNQPNIFKSYSYYGKHDNHPAEKTVDAVSRFVEWLSDSGCLVLDPFMGSGTTGVACARLGRRFIGIEIEERYFEIACKRIEAAYAQGRLFEPEPVTAEQTQLFDEVSA